jgi:flagellar M-ring protein FliF
VRNEVREIGGVKRLSVAVALNAAAAPREPAELSRIASLVQAAVGYNPARGDQVSIVETPFQPAQSNAQGTGGTAATTPAAPESETRLPAGEIAAAAAIIIALIAFVLRPLLTGPVAPPANAQARGAAAASATALPAPALSAEAAAPAASIRRVAEVVKTNASESAVILKDWIRKAS